MMTHLSPSSSTSSSSVDQQEEQQQEKQSRSTSRPAPSTTSLSSLSSPSSSSSDDMSIVTDTNNNSDPDSRKEMVNTDFGTGNSSCLVGPSPTPSGADGNSIKKNDRPLSVTFSGVCTMRRTIHVNDYTPEELLACFWQEDELAVINERNAHMIVYMEMLEELHQLKQQNKQGQGQQPYTRGLEHHTSQARRRKMTARQCQYEAVMVVEELMMTKTRFDAVKVGGGGGGGGELVDDDTYYANLLAETCRQISSPCVEEAVRRARFDEWKATSLAER